MRDRSRKCLRFVPLLSLLTASVAGISGTPSARRNPTGLPAKALAERVQTSAAGDHFQVLPPVHFSRGKPSQGLVVTIDPSVCLQALEGIGGALTEASAFVLAHLPEGQRQQILDGFFGPRGADFTMARVPIGACDFCVTGRYSYDDLPGDVALEHFSIAPDKRGFPTAECPSYALLPLIKDAQSRQPALKVVASPWSAPAWMKDNHDWYGQGRGGSLMPEHYDTFARYMVKYLDAYRAEGVAIWGVTPENEPLGNGGQWESMEFTAQGLRRYIGEHLGPQLTSHGYASVKLIQFDHNRDANALQFAQAVLGDPVASPFTWGTGLHWYGATNSADTSVLDTLCRAFPTKAILHTEGCIDAIGTEDNAPSGQFLGWKNDGWWWHEDATDWGYHWAPPEEKQAHPRYAPVHRYARDLVEGLNHGFVGWIDWNIVLDKRGGPNHVNNFCAAPVMVDTESKEVYTTPLFFVMAHFSRYLRPGDRIVKAVIAGQSPLDTPLLATAALSRNRKHLVVVVFNPSDHALACTLQVGRLIAPLTMTGHSLQTLRIPLTRSTPSAPIQK
jgi:glucosylceramidase